MRASLLLLSLACAPKVAPPEVVVPRTVAPAGAPAQARAAYLAAALFEGRGRLAAAQAALLEARAFDPNAPALPRAQARVALRQGDAAAAAAGWAAALPLGAPPGALAADAAGAPGVAGRAAQAVALRCDLAAVPALLDALDAAGVDVAAARTGREACGPHGSTPLGG